MSEDQTSQNNPEKEEQSWKTHTSPFQNLLQTTVIKTMWYWHKNKHIDQWNKIKKLEINPSIFGQLTSDKGPSQFNRRKNSFFNRRCWDN